MKAKKLLALLLSFVLLLCVLCGCGGGSKGTADNGVQAETAPGAAADDYLADGGFADESVSSIAVNRPTNAKLIYTGDLNLQATDLDVALQALSAVVDEFGGYVEGQEIHRQSYYKSAYYTVRVPGERFHAFLASVSESAAYTLTYQNISVQDVGEAYADIENRLETLHIKLERLQTLLTQAVSMEDIITIESSISEVEYEIERYSSDKNHYDSLINYSTVHISLEEVKITDSSVDPTLGERISTGFRRGMRNFADGCEDAIVFLVSNCISVVVFLVVAAAVITLIVRRDRKVRRARKEKAKPAEEPKE